MGNKKYGRIRQIAKRIIESLKEVPCDVAIKAGVEVDFIPLPVLKFFAEIRLLHKTTNRMKQRKENASRKENHKCLYSNDEGIGKRDKT